jgi:hypothetical protein
MRGRVTRTRRTAYGARMRRNFLRPPSEAERHARYPVRVLVAPSVEPGGVSHGPPAARELLAWREIEQVAIAEVGEPEGVRTVVYDLICRKASDIAVFRLDAEPGEAAMALARQLEAALGHGRASAALKSISADGLATLWYPDLRAFEEDSLAELERGA